MSFIVGIDASRNRSGGAIANLIGVLSHANPQVHGISKIHVWSYRRLLNSLPNTSWLVKHNPPELEKSLAHQVWWQYRKLAKEARKNKCDILYATDASTLCRFDPTVVMSQDMLSYEPGIMQSFGFTKARLRLIALLLIQNRAMRYAKGVIFLTRYAAQVIQSVAGKLHHVSIIPHGIDPSFRQQLVADSWPERGERPIRCLYVSNAAMYKHQWQVVRAVSKLRQRGYDVDLILAGGGTGRAQHLLEAEVTVSDPQRTFVKCLGQVSHEELPSLLASADLFVFASGCENLPVTLLEAMAVGLPIACSDRGPMPEVLGDGGVYFDPEKPDSIASALETIIVDPQLRSRIMKRTKELSEQYSWERCSRETWEFLSETAGGTSQAYQGALPVRVKA